MSRDSTFPLEVLATLPEYHHPVASPAGDRVAFYYDGSGRNRLNVLDVETGERRRVGDDVVTRDPTYPIVWGPDGERIYFHDDEGSDEQNDIHAVTLDGDHEVVVDTDSQTYLRDVSDDGRYLLYLGNASGQRNVHRYDTETGTDDRLTGYDRPVHDAAFGPDGDRIAYTTSESENLRNLDVYVAAADGSDPRRLDIGDAGVETTFSDWSPDGSAVLVRDESDGLTRCVVYDLESRTARPFGPGEYDERPDGFHPDGERFLARRRRRCGSVPVVYDLESGEGRELALDDGVVSFARGPFGGGYLADGSVLVSYATTDTREELYRWDLDADEGEVLVEAEYGDVDPDGFVEAEYVTYESTGTDDVFGTEGEAFEIEALLYDSGERPSAGVVSVHGGPHWRAARSFDLHAQFLVSRGYTVLKPNYRGSIGRGRAFKNAIHGDWGGLEQEDVAAAGRWLRRRDWIDEDRVAVYGKSYGGYSVYVQLVKHPRLWAAGVAWVGFTDLPSLYEESMPRFQAALRQQMGDPDENEALWRERSPLTHVENVERPVLILHGVNDPRCPVSQARRFRAALEERGWEAGEDFVYEELGNEGHGVTDVDRRVRVFRTLADFLDDRV